MQPRVDKDNDHEYNDMGDEYKEHDHDHWYNVGSSIAF